MSDVLRISANSPVLGSCSEADREAFESHVERQYFPCGTTILTEGEEGQCLWLLLKGTVQVVKDVAGRDPQHLATLEPGSIFGEMSFLQRAPHSASVVAMEDVEVARLSPEEFNKLREECPSAAFCIVMNLVTVIAERLRRMDKRISEILKDGGHEHRNKEWHDFRARLFAGWDF